jgi:hypothetical protein
MGDRLWDDPETYRNELPSVFNTLPTKKNLTSYREKFGKNREFGPRKTRAMWTKAVYLPTM